MVKDHRRRVFVKAYEFAHEADPNAELYYNDYSLENAPKRGGAVALIRKLQAAGVHIAAVGLQGHYKMDWPSAAQVDSTINVFAAIGVKVNITELDIDVVPATQINRGADLAVNSYHQVREDIYANGLPDSVQAELAKRYGELFSVFVKHSGEVGRVTFWGVRTMIPGSIPETVSTIRYCSTGTEGQSQPTMLS